MKSSDSRDNPIIDIRTFFRADSTDIQKHLGFINQAFHLRILLLGWPELKRREYLKNWFRKNNHLIFEQVKALARKNISSSDIKSVTKILSVELSQILIEISDDDLSKQFAEAVTDFSAQHKHAACRSRILHYHKEAGDLVIADSSKDSPSLEKIQNAWVEIYENAMSLQTTFEYGLYIAHEMAKIGYLLIMAYLNYDHFEEIKKGELQPLLTDLIGTGLIAVIICHSLSKFHVYQEMLKQAYYLVTNKEPMPVLELELFQGHLHQGIISYLNRRALDHNAAQVNHHHPYTMLMDVLSLQLPEPKESVFTKESTSLVSSKLERASESSTTQEEKEVPQVRQPALEQFNDHVIRTGDEYSHLLQMKLKNVYVRFNPKRVQDFFADENERKTIPNRFFTSLQHERKLPPPARTERNAKNNPYYQMTGKFQLPGTPYRLAFIKVPPRSDEEKKLASVNPHVQIQEPVKLVQHGKKGYP